MDYGFTEAQELLRTSVKEFVANEVPLTHVREMEEDPKGFSPELWHKLAQLDWVGLDYPEQYGGVGGCFVDVAVVAEEMGRALVPSPYLSTSILAGHTILAAGSHGQKDDLLPRIARGDMILTLALTEPSASYEASDVETTGVPASDGGYILNGTKLFVPFANSADRLIVVARTGESGSPEARISLFLIDPRVSGVSIAPMRIISSENQGEVILRDVKVPAENLLGALNGGWPAVRDALDKAKVAMSAEMVGGARAAVDMAISYAHKRMQFGGPIGRFQAIQHMLADSATEIEGARWLIYEAASGIAEGSPSPATISMTKAFISDVYVRAARTAAQVHGGYSYMKECDIQLYFRRAKAAEAIFGDAFRNRQLAAQQLGL